jgi:aminoglycoside phosphotransferase (APT) family kinase protein
MIDQEEVERVVGSRVSRVWALTGGWSARVVGVEVSDGSVLVVRKHSRPDFELAVMRAAREGGIPAPEPYRVVDSYLLMELVEGEPPATPDCVPELAETLAAIHRLEPIPGLPTRDLRPGRRVESQEEKRIRDVLDSARLAKRNEPVFLHGDFWPGNTLWANGELRAVIDWEDAAVGDPLADVGNVRLEILWAFGDEAMRTFTDEYAAAMPSVDHTDLPLWDLRAWLKLAPGVALFAEGVAAKEQLWRERAAEFAAAALALSK